MIFRRTLDIRKGEFSGALRYAFGKKDSRDRLAKWEAETAKYIGVKHALAVSSGRHSLELILTSLNLKRGDEIIVSAYTLRELIPIIQRLGLMVIFADIDRTSFNMDPADVKRKITAKTKVILVTHMFGNPCRIDELMRLAKAHNLYMIEDCAHSIGSEINGKKTGSFGEAAFFSFESMKMVNTYGGGLITTDSSAIDQKIRKRISAYETSRLPLLKKVFVAFFEDRFINGLFGKTFLTLLSYPKMKNALVSSYRIVQGHPTSKSRYSAFQAGIGLKKLKDLDSRIARRRKAAELIRSTLHKQVAFQKTESAAKTNYYFFTGTVRCDTQKLRRRALRRGIDIGILDELTHDCASFMGKRNFPNTRYVFSHSIQLPLDENISLEQIRMITDVLRSEIPMHVRS